MGERKKDAHTDRQRQTERKSYRQNRRKEDGETDRQEWRKERKTHTQTDRPASSRSNVKPNQAETERSS